MYVGNEAHDPAVKTSPLVSSAGELAAARVAAVEDRGVGAQHIVEDLVGESLGVVFKRSFRAGVH